MKTNKMKIKTIQIIQTIFYVKKLIGNKDGFYILMYLNLQKKFG